MFSVKKIWIFFLVFLFITCIIYACKGLKPSATASLNRGPRVLVFSKMAGYYLESIADVMIAIQKSGKENNFLVDTTTDAGYFNEERLKQYNAVIFLSITQDELNVGQQVAFERFIQAGGGFAVVHTATDTGNDWPWYNKLVGTYFLGHPKQEKAIVNIRNKDHISNSLLPDRWERLDEWYIYKSIMPHIKMLKTLDEDTYEAGINGGNHPFIGFLEFDGGRYWYTGLEHTTESYNEPLLLQHLLSGIKYAIGNNKFNYSKSYAVRSPDDNRFTKTILSRDLNEPTDLTVAPDGRVFFSERAGNFYVFDPLSKKTKLLRDFRVKASDKYFNNLIGITLDPRFQHNNYIYFFYYSSNGNRQHQNLSRFTLTRDNNLDIASEKIIIQIPVDVDMNEHTGGSLAWDKNRNLYISTNDNTMHFRSDGFSPPTERSGRIIYDTQLSAVNPNNLVGKILRIHPEPDGSYTIPQGNLFPVGTNGTRPEIYIMGCRSPSRISVDTATSIIYWGEACTDAGNDSRHVYNEFKQAKSAGNFSWQYFIGNSKAYHDSDFAVKIVGDSSLVNGTENNSPDNSGMKNISPPQQNMIWYPYARSAEFPNLGEGVSCSIGGLVYHYDSSLQSNRKLPAYYDKALFIHDLTRNWVFVVHLDENHDFKGMEPFMYTNGNFRRPVDIEFGSDGAMYMLEYGSVYGNDNVGARLVRIDYNGGNRAPVAKITTNDTIGLVPFKISLSSKSSYDYDENDKLSYQWTLNNQVISTDPNTVYTFQNNGIYHAVLKATDVAGQSSMDTVEIKVGNTLPKVAIHVADNSTFFFDKPTVFRYVVDAKDNEDKVIDRQNLRIAMKYIPKVASDGSLPGYLQSEDYNYGRNLISGSNCYTCHQPMGISLIPSFMQVSEKYWGNPNAIGILANKIITGGTGVWGEQVMIAHPQLSREDATEIVKYILFVSNKRPDMEIPKEGTEVLRAHVDEGNEGRYIFTASYTDQGGAIMPLTGKDVVVLRPSKVEAESADVIYNLQKGTTALGSINNNSYFVLKNIDLKDIHQLRYRYSSKDHDATIEVHIDSLKGQVISSAGYKATGSWDKYKETSAGVADPGGKHDLYFLFVKNDASNRNLVLLDWITFEGGNEVKAIERIVPVGKVSPANPGSRILWPGNRIPFKGS